MDLLSWSVYFTNPKCFRQCIMLLFVSQICLVPIYASTPDDSHDIPSEPQGNDIPSEPQGNEVVPGFPDLDDPHRVLRRSPHGDPSSSAQHHIPSRSNPPSRTCTRNLRNATSAEAVNNNISSFEEMKMYRVMVIKDEILKKLRLNSAPNVTIDGRELRSMSRILDIGEPDRPADDQMADDDLSTPVVMIVQSRAVPAIAFNTSNSCYFKFPDDLNRGSQVIEAHLGVHLRRDAGLSTWRDHSSLRLQLKKNSRRWRFERARHKRIQLNNIEQWYTFDVKALVQSWINHPSSNLGITIETIPHVQSLPIVQPRNPEEETLRPFIEIQVKPSGVTRQPRSTGMDCSEGSQEQRCCRYPLSIDFEEFSWDWIMVPKRYDAYYCSGKCNYLYYESPSLTAVYRQVSSPSIGNPCCAPTQVVPLSIIYYDEKLPGVVHSSIPGMVVKQCGCQ